jgi:hypothetical protein
MKQVFTLLLLAVSLTAAAQNVGIGTASPSEKLEVAGSIKLGASANAASAPGTLRWNSITQDFEGFNGRAWVSLTAGKSGWGGQQSYSPENGASNRALHYFNVDTYGQLLGRSLSVEGHTLVVGAPDDIDNNTSPNGRTGSVLIYQWDGQRWQFTTDFMPLAYPAGDNATGFSVSLSGNRIAAGAPKARIGTEGMQGRVLILPAQPGGRHDFVSVTASDGNAGDYFGTSVALQGNYLLVGAPYAYANGHGAEGKAYLYVPFIGGNNWLETQQFTSPDGAASDHFGSAVALDGSWAAIGAPDAAAPGQKAGKVYLYHRTGTTWNYITTLASGETASRFGSALHLKGDTLVVGAPHNGTAGGTGQGHAYVYVRNGTSWNLQATLTAADGHPGDGYGTSVHRQGNLLIAGAPWATVYSKEKQGKAYVYRLGGGTWQQEAVLTLAGGEANAYLGSSVVITPFAAAAGAPYAELNDFKDNGQVYFFHR